MWKEYELTVNSLPQKVRFNDVTVEELFLPLIQKLSDLEREKNRRIVAFVAAPPATGKSTLTLFLEQLAREKNIPLQATGLDGFHYPNAYLDTHYVEKDGEKILMRRVKGSPETFNAEHLAEKLAELRRNDKTTWPVYSRKLHDPVEDEQILTEKIILLEGNWLLLKDSRWANLRDFADYTLLITADAQTLKERLIGRKVQGGVTRQEAQNFYETSDKANVERTLRDSGKADETWHMTDDGDFRRV